MDSHTGLVSALSSDKQCQPTPDKRSPLTSNDLDPTAMLLFQSISCMVLVWWKITLICSTSKNTTQNHTYKTILFLFNRVWLKVCFQKSLIQYLRLKYQQRSRQDGHQTHYDSRSLLTFKKTHKLWSIATLPQQESCVYLKSLSTEKAMAPFKRQIKTPVSHNLHKPHKHTSSLQRFPCTLSNPATMLSILCHPKG